MILYIAEICKGIHSSSWVAAVWGDVSDVFNFILWLWHYCYWNLRNAEMPKLSSHTNMGHTVNRYIIAAINLIEK